MCFNELFNKFYLKILNMSGTCTVCKVCCTFMGSSVNVFKIEMLFCLTSLYQFNANLSCMLIEFADILCWTSLNLLFIIKKTQKVYMF